MWVFGLVLAFCSYERGCSEQPCAVVFPGRVLDRLGHKGRTCVVSCAVVFPGRVLDRLGHKGRTCVVS